MAKRSSTNSSVDADYPPPSIGAAVSDGVINARIVYMNTIPVADARANLSKLIDEASSTHERTEITKNGRRAAVLLGVGDYDAMRETIAVLSVENLLRSHADGQRALDAGEAMDALDLAGAMKDAGRRVEPK